MRRWLITLLAVTWAVASSALAAGTTVQVFAASSLTEAFEDLARRFEALHPDIDVVLTFAGSQTLRLQIEQGARADVFASADERHLRALVDLGDVAEADPFARNELVVIVPLDNPAELETFADLARARRIVLGTERAPIGAATRAVLAAAAERLGEPFAAMVREHVVSEESNVRLVRAKVELGEADAAIVYRTDALASNAVRTIPIPDEVNVSTLYVIGRVERSPVAAAADLFIAFVGSPEGRMLLQGRGFVVAP